jgi:hypothetical protein
MVRRNSTMNDVDIEQAAKIAERNDAFRKSGYGITITEGIQAMDDIAGLMRAVRAFNKFTEDNDPHKEHDFGSLEWEGQKIFWKIDYYDKTFRYWCDPLDPKCNRVLTVMLAGEY